MLRTVLLAMLLSTPAVARNLPPRPEPVIAVKLSERVKPAAPTPPPMARPAFDQLDAVLGAPIGSLDTAAMTQLEARVATEMSGSDEQLRTLYELGLHYDRHARYWRARGAELQTAADRAVSDRQRHATLTRDALAAMNKGKDFLLKGVKSFRAVSDTGAFLQKPYGDDLLFRYGYLLESFRYMKEARDQFDRLLKNFPSSKHVASAHLAFAEYYFDQNMLADAEARYKMVLKFPKSIAYQYAKYKLGWIDFNLQRYQEALELFFEVTRAGTPDLATAARLDFVRAYAEIGKADKAFAAFGRVDSRAAFDMLVYLGGIYLGQGRADRAVYVFGELQKQAPTDARVCAWQYEITRATLSVPGATVDDKLVAIENLVKLSTALSARLPAAAVQTCRADAIAFSTELGRAFHSEFAKTRNPSTLDAALRLYQAYLAAFPTDANRPAIAYLHAEALWTRATIETRPTEQTRLAERAAIAFTELATIDPTRAATAKRAALLASFATIDDAYVSTVVPPLSKGAPAPPQPLGAREAALIDTIHALAASSDPRDPDLGMLWFAQANMLRRANQHALAAPIYVSLVTTHPTAAFSEAAGVLAIDSLVLVQKLDDMLLLADRLAADQQFLADKPDLAAAVKLVRSRSMRR